MLDRSFRQTRVFSKGPFARFGPAFSIEPEGRGSRVVYALEWEPLGLVGRLSGARLTEKAGAVVARRVEEAVAFLRGQRQTVFDFPAPTLPAGARERALALADAVDAGPYGHKLGRRLVEHLLTGMEVDIARLKPKLLARVLGVGSRQAAELCLASVRAGLLTMKWDLLCTNCRGAKVSTAALSELPRGAHCPSCNIDYDRDFERNIELTCAPSPTIRPTGQGAFCLSGPTMTPHVLAQQLLARGERRVVEIDLPPGSYRLRTLHPSRPLEFDHAGGPLPGLRATPDGVEAMAPGAAGTMAFHNDADFELAALIEDRTWTRESLTAPEVISLQAFRDLFAAATLRPGDEAGISQVTLLFSDLRGSTALYERLGDAQAFNLVREHFSFLAGIVREHDGAVVKTIGDAVMAAFDDPAHAVTAALAMQTRIEAFNHAQPGNVAGDELTIKLGVHAGPSVVVNMNDRLDYFGSTVNMAARLQGQSAGGDIVLSRAVAEDPVVAPLLARHDTRRESVALKGFAEPVPFVRVLPAAATVAAAASA